jgi:hypothetical protein
MDIWIRDNTAVTARVQRVEEITQVGMAVEIQMGPDDKSAEDCKKSNGQLL